LRAGFAVEPVFAAQFSAACRCVALGNYALLAFHLRPATAAKPKPSRAMLDGSGIGPHTHSPAMFVVSEAQAAPIRRLHPGKADGSASR